MEGGNITGLLATYHKRDNLIPVVFNAPDVRIFGLKPWRDQHSAKVARRIPPAGAPPWTNQFQCFLSF